MVDSEPLQLEAFNSVLNEFGVTLSMEDFKHTYMGTRDTQMSERMVVDFHLTLSPDEFLRKKRNAYATIYATRTIQPTVGLIDALTVLSSQMPLGIASSSSMEEIQLVLQSFNIAHFFKGVASAHDCERGKPHPDVYLRAAEFLGVEPHHCAILEDTNTGLLSARRAGMKCIAITTTYKRDEIHDADAIIETFAELIPTLEKI